MSEENSTINGPITGSIEARIQLLQVRKKELLIKKRLMKNADEIQHIENLLQEIDEVINRCSLPPTMRRRRKTDDQTRH